MGFNSGLKGLIMSSLDQKEPRKEQQTNKNNHKFMV